jgi:transcriptional regulator with XRE-family HTH domain
MAKSGRYSPKHDSPRRGGQGESVPEAWQGISRRIIQARIDSDLTQRELAAAIGVTDRSVSYWEQRYRLPQLPQLFRVAQVTGRTIDWFLQDVPPDDGIDHGEVKGLAIAIG